MGLRKYILILVFGVLCSCTANLDEFQVSGKDCIALTVYNTSMSTKANGDITQDAGVSCERLLTRLDIFLYPEGKTDKECVFYKHVSGINNTSGSQTVPVYVSEEIAKQLFPNDATRCDVYVVANIPDNIKFEGNETVDEIGSIAIRSEEFKRVVASDGTFVAPEKFIMSSYSSDNTGICKVQRSGETITGNIPLKRAASKITMTVLVPEYINVKAHDTSNDTYINEVWRPYFSDSLHPENGVQTMHMGFHKGVLTTMVEGNGALSNIDELAEGEESDRFETLYTEKFSYVETISKTVTGEDGTTTIKNYYRYLCDISFYSYPFSWEGKDNDVEAPYFTLMLPWRRDGDERFTTYYYQVVVNGLSQKMERNYWYDIRLNIGVLGSRDYNYPAELDDMSCYILDWSDGNDGLKEDVDLSEWRYLVVPQTYIEMNNTNKG